MRVISHWTDAVAGFSPGTSVSSNSTSAAHTSVVMAVAVGPFELTELCDWLIMPLQQKIFLRFVARDYEMVEKSCIFIGGCGSGNDNTTAISHEALHNSGSFCRTQGTIWTHSFFNLFSDTLRHLYCTSVPEVFWTQLPVSVAYPGIFFRGGFNKFSRGQRTERTGIWGR